MRERRQRSPAPVFDVRIPRRQNSRGMAEIWRAMAAIVWRQEIKSVQEKLDAQRRLDAEEESESRRQNGQSQG